MSVLKLSPRKRVMSTKYPYHVVPDTSKYEVVPSLLDNTNVGISQLSPGPSVNPPTLLLIRSLRQTIDGYQKNSESLHSKIKDLKSALEKERSKSKDLQKLLLDARQIPCAPCQKDHNVYPVFSHGLRQCDVDECRC